MGARKSPEALRAIELVEGGMTAYAAAKKCRIDMSTIYRHMKNRKRKRLKKTD